MRGAWWVAVGVLVAVPAWAKDAPPTKKGDQPSAPTKGESSSGTKGGETAKQAGEWKPEWAALWNEALAKEIDRALGANENGYRLKVRVGKPSTSGGAQSASTSFWFSEIDTSADEPKWTKEKQLRKALPGGIALTERGVYFLDKPLYGAALATHVKKGKPTVGVEGTGRVEVREIGGGQLTCFVPGPGRKSAPSAELCLAKGKGIAAVKGGFPQDPELVFLDPAFVQER